jgi:hypothetical protein
MNALRQKRLDYSTLHEQLVTGQGSYECAGNTGTIRNHRKRFERFSRCALVSRAAAERQLPFGRIWLPTV